MIYLQTKILSVLEIANLTDFLRYFVNEIAWIYSNLLRQSLIKQEKKTKKIL